MCYTQHWWRPQPKAAVNCLTNTSRTRSRPRSWQASTAQPLHQVFWHVKLYPNTHATWRPDLSYPFDYKTEFVMTDLETDAEYLLFREPVQAFVPDDCRSMSGHMKVRRKQQRRGESHSEVKIVWAEAFTTDYVNVQIASEFVCTVMSRSWSVRSKWNI